MSRLHLVAICLVIFTIHKDAISYLTRVPRTKLTCVRLTEFPRYASFFFAVNRSTHESCAHS